MVNLEDASLQFLNKTLHDARLLIPVNEEENPNEYLLLFNNLGVYVDTYGRRSRAQELMFPCRLADLHSSVAFHRPYLCLYSENQIDVFNVTNSEWAQTINLKRARPLNDNGLFSICMVADMPYLVLLSSIVQPIEEQLFVPPTPQTIQGKGVQKRRRKFSVKSSREDSARFVNKLKKCFIFL